MIYLASPYSHPDSSVREARFLAACRHAAGLASEGQAVFSPIVHSHPIATQGGRALPTDFAFWRETDAVLLRRSDRLRVLMLAGWRESRGVAEEIAMAAAVGLGIEYVEPGDG